MISFEGRQFPGFDELDEYPLYHTLRIPPLQHPILPGISRRPSPLEPNALVNDGTRQCATRLTTRAKAGGSAKSNGNEESVLSSANASRDKPALDYVDPSSLIEGARKRQKLDYFQLPKPTTNPIKSSKPPSFTPIPLLNKLHEPPPSAALFPPITPNLPDEQEVISSSKISLPERTRSAQSTGRPVKPNAEEETKPKRVYLRGRRPWTTEETDDLLKGVGIYGAGKWKSILHHVGLRFHPDRTTVDLKDRYRTCRLNEERSLDRDAFGKREACEESSSPKSPVGLVHQASNQNVEKPENADDKCEEKKQDTSTLSSTNPLSFSVCTPADVRSQLANASPSKKNGSSERKSHQQRWTKEEDMNLSRGFQKYGFHWNAIAKDSDVGLLHRTPQQIKDRFRVKYPLHYQSSVPIPLPDPPTRSRQRRTSCDLLETKHTVKAAFAAQKDLAWILRDASNIVSIQASSQREPSGQKFCIQMTRREALDSAKPLEDSDGEESEDAENAGNPSTDSQETIQVELADDHDVASSIQGQIGSASCGNPQLTPPASLTTGDYSRQGSIEADDTRYMNIEDLLNEDTETPSRLPPFKYSFDNEWGSDSLRDCVTLPPLLWEDMATRPLFEL